MRVQIVITIAKNRVIDADGLQQLDENISYMCHIRKKNEALLV